MARAILSPVITNILVGPEEVKFSIHKALLCERTEYFRKAYNTSFKEAQEHLFRFADIDHAVFQTFVRWLYTSEIFLGPSDESPLQLVNASGSNAGSDDSSYVGGSEASEWEDEDEDDEDDDDGDANEVDWSDDDMAYYEEMSQERKQIWDLIQFDGEASQLDVYRLQVILELTEGCFQYEQYRQKWQDILEDKLRDEEGDTSQEAIAEGSTTFTKLIDLYIVADRLQVPELQDMAITHLHNERYRRSRLDREDNLPTFENVSRAFDNVADTSPLRTWLVDVFAYDWDPVTDSTEQIAAREHLPGDFLMEMTLHNTSRLQHPGKSDVPIFDLDLCYYHQHRTWAEVKACREARGKDPNDGILSCQDFQGN